MTLLACALALVQGTPGPLVDPAVLFARETVDHRRSQSPVKDQGDRGTCAAFALCGAMETFPGVPTDLCEQLLYATVKLHENRVDEWLRAFGRAAEEMTLDEGNSFREYLPLFGLVGTCHESVWPYDPKLVRVGEEVPEPIRRFLELARITPDDLARVRDAAGKWGFRPEDAELLDRKGAQDVARLKAELKGGTLAIPVGYRIHGPSWSNLETAGAPVHKSSVLGGGARVAVHPGMLHVFAPRPAEGAAPAWMSYGDARARLRAQTRDLAQEVLEGRWLQGRQRPEAEYGGHAVLLVGYDDEGFIAKNSWGTGWGAGGYFLVPYDYHRMYVNGGAILRAPAMRTPSLSPFERGARMAKAAVRLKVQPRIVGEEDALVLSTWFEDLRDPDVEAVHYVIERRGPGGAWSPLAERFVWNGPPERRTGAPWAVTGETLAALRAGGETRVRARYGFDVLDPADPSGATYRHARVFPRIPAAPRGAVDIVGTP